MPLSELERQEKRHVPIQFRSLLNPNTERRMRKFWREVFASTFSALEFAGNCKTIHTTPTIGMTIISLPKKITRKFGRHGIMQGRTVLSLGIVILLAALEDAHAQKVVWRSDIRQAAAAASKSQKPMLVDFTATWCTYCKKMKKTYEHRDIAKHLQSCFILVRLDADQNQKLMNAIDVEALPTTVILSPKFEVIKKIQGYRTPAELKVQLEKFCNHTPKQKRIAKRTTRPAISKPPANPVPFAFKQLCLVTLLEKREMKYGNAKFSSKFHGQEVCFASAEMKRNFDANPEKYWPVLNGNCVVNYADRRTNETGNPGWVAVYRDRIWFFATDSERQQFAKTPDRYSAYGTRNIAQSQKSKSTRN